MTWLEEQSRGSRGFDVGADGWQAPSSSNLPSSKAMFEPKGDSIFKTEEGYVAVGIVEGARPFLLEMLPTGVEPSKRFISCTSKDFGLVEFRSVCGTRSLWLGIQRDGDSWHLPSRTREMYFKMRRLWQKLSKGLF